MSNTQNTVAMEEIQLTGKTDAKIVDIPPTVTTVPGSGEAIDAKAIVADKKAAAKEAADNKVTYGQLFRYASKYDIVLMVMGTICALAHGTGMPIMTIVFANIIGGFFAVPVDADALNDDARRGCIQFVILAVALFVLAYGQMTFWMIAGENQAKRIRQLYFKALLRQDIGWFDQVTTGELTTRMIADTTMIQEGISEKVGLILQFLCTFITGFIIAYFKGWRLALVLTACLPLIVGAATLMTQALAAGSATGNTAYAAAGGLAQQVISGIRTVVAFGGEERALARYTILLQAAEKMAIKSSIVSALGIGFVQLIIFSVYSMAFWYGARQIVAGTMSGQEVLNCFFALIIGAFSLGQAMPSFTSLANAQGAAYKVFSTIDRISPIDASAPGGEKPAKVEGSMSFTNVDFHYPSRPDVPILKNFLLQVKAGSSVALVGGSGSGKSTIVKLLERFYDPIAGGITLDGRPLESLNVTWLRQQIGIVSQEPTLFNTTLRQNLIYGLPESPSKYTEAELDAMVESACRTANAWDFIQALPQGIHTQIAGTTMSGGQKQRIAIARMVMRDPRIVLLDEATSALDTTSERLVQAALEKASAGRTTITIAHRLSTIKNSDLIVVMDRGVIVESGTHDSLLEKNGAYASLVAAQRLRGASGKNDSQDVSPEESIAEETESPATDTNPVKLVGDAPVAVNLTEVPPAPQRSASLKPGQATSPSGGKKHLTLIEKEELQEAQRAERLKQKVPIMRLVRMNQPEVVFLTLGVLCALGTGAVMPVFSLVFASILGVFGLPDHAEMQRQANWWALGFLGLAVGAFAFQFLQVALLRYAGDKLTTRLRIASFKSIVSQDIGFFDEEKNNTGSLTGALAEDATLVQGLTGQTFAQFVSLISTFGVGLGIAFASCWQLTLVVIACVPLVGAGGYLQLKSLTGAGDNAKKAYRGANQTANEAIESIRTVQTLTQEDTFIQQYADLIEIPHQVVVRGAWVSSAGFASTESAVFLTYAVAFYYGSRLIINGTYGGTPVMKAMFAVIFAAMGAGQVANFAPDAAKAKLAALAIFDLLDRTSRIDASDPSGLVKESKGEPSGHDLQFSYPSRPDIPILRGLNLSAAPGETVALVGNSGCGKSTVMGLLERWYDALGGQMKLDGSDVREWNLRSLRGNMALVGQEPVLISDTLRENIEYGAIGGKATHEQIEAAARAANIHDFVVSLPKGYDTLVGEKGGQLSGGQKQRIAIARALIRNPKVLLLDEATSALDSESEKVVQDALDKASSGRTTLVIAHRLSTIQNANKIICVVGGKVAEQGTHEELVELGGAYAELVLQQTLQKVDQPE
ncbi:Multidrug resistance protein 1 [Thoreauomyces humboldtii]|nr:Multidrug resistance protein 1 [Thoreauomyces humboldtii]